MEGWHRDKTFSCATTGTIPTKLWLTTCSTMVRCTGIDVCKILIFVLTKTAGILTPEQVWTPSEMSTTEDAGTLKRMRLLCRTNATLKLKVSPSLSIRESVTLHQHSRRREQPGAMSHVTQSGQRKELRQKRDARLAFQSRNTHGSWI
jgi:hypothetical protein